MGEKAFKVGEAGDRVEIGQDWPGSARIGQDRSGPRDGRPYAGWGWAWTTRRLVINMRRRATMRVRIAGAAWNPDRSARQSVDSP